MTGEQHAALIRMFAAHGYTETVQIAHALDQGEYTLLLKSAMRRSQPDAALITEAESILGRPVSIRFAD